jgi:predicted amino acid racemase
MPILPEHRILVNMQRAIEDEFGIRLDGTGDGNSCSIELIKAAIEDVLYNLRTGELVVDAEGKVVTARGEKPQIQFKMDACRAMSKIQQTSIGYTFPNVSEAPNSPYSTTEVCVFEDDDHWDSVQINAKLTLGEMNAVIADPVVKLPDGSDVEFDVYAGSDLSNAGDTCMLCVSSCNGPFPSAICECKRELQELH